MSRITYEQARADHEYLWSIAPAQDMSGGYVDQDDLARLLKNPTKATARDCYVAQIHHWFSLGPDATGSDGRGDAAEWIESDPRVREIAVRHGVVDDFEDDDDGGQP